MNHDEPAYFSPAVDSLEARGDCLSACKDLTFKRWERKSAKPTFLEGAEMRIIPPRWDTISP